jgi:hypothetical protein
VTGEPAVGLDNSQGQYSDQLKGIGLRTAANILVSAIPSNVFDFLEFQTAGPGSNANQAAGTYYSSVFNTRAILGKQIGSRWFLGLSTGLCFASSSTFKDNLGLQLEYRIKSLYSAQAAIEPGSSDARCARGTTTSFQPTQTPSQLGFDLFRNWRF